MSSRFLDIMGSLEYWFLRITATNVRFRSTLQSEKKMCFQLYNSWRLFQFVHGGLLFGLKIFAQQFNSMQTRFPVSSKKNNLSALRSILFSRRFPVCWLDSVFKFICVRNQTDHLVLHNKPTHHYYYNKLLSIEWRAISCRS